MRKFLIPAALLASTVAIASPAAAQWYPGNPPVPQGYAYGYQNNYGQVQRLEARVNQMRRDIREMDRRRILSNSEARSLDKEARNIQERIWRAGRGGLNGYEMRDVEVRTQRLAYRIQREANDRDGQWKRHGYGYGNAYGYSNGAGYNDRDRDGRNDRYEDDRGTQHDYGRR